MSSGAQNTTVGMSESQPETLSCHPQPSPRCKLQRKVVGETVPARILPTSNL